jgi:hypothetical protein
MSVCIACAPTGGLFFKTLPLVQSKHKSIQQDKQPMLFVQPYVILIKGNVWINMSCCETSVFFLFCQPATNIFEADFVHQNVDNNANINPAYPLKTKKHCSTII